MADWFNPMERLARELVYGPDYNMQGFIESGGKLPTKEGQHLPDTYKTPVHPTFSDESIYNGGQGGSWRKGPDGRWHFFASQGNVMNYGAQNLMDYFKQVEPDASLHLPASAGYSNPLLWLLQNYLGGNR